MSAGGRRIPHASWCPALSNAPPRPRRVVKGIVVEWEPAGPRFVCLCKADRLQLTDPRPEVVQEAVDRHRDKEGRRA